MTKQFRRGRAFFRKTEAGFALLAALLSWAAFGTAASAEEGCMTAKCHQSLLKGAKVIHSPLTAGDCSSCHSPHSPGTKSKLTAEGNALCFTCHYDIQEETKKKVVHPALLGGCTSCHNPHGSPFRKLLSAQATELCVQCHPAMGEKMKGPGSSHPPVTSERGCLSCHRPHAGDAPRLLLKESGALCLDCHRNIVSKTMKTLHGPVRDGSCSVCHDPHGSANRKLLSTPFPATPYVAYTGKEYELCFTCHSREMVGTQQTATETGFRDGTRNLHYLHVNNREKGRSCSLCHDLHGSSQPKLLQPTLLFGKWQLPLKFQMTDMGGSCSPGCHKPLSYDRKDEGKAQDQQRRMPKK